MNLKQHPLSAAFPAMQSDEYQALYDSIMEIGVQNPITLFEGMVIDGWNRYSASNVAGMVCPTVNLAADVDPVDFVKSQNLHRRHLTGSQRAAAVVACSNWQPAHRPVKSVPGTDLIKTDAYMAKEAGVSISTVGQVKAAQKAGLLEPVRDGALTAKEAAQVARGVPEKAPAKPPAKPAPVVEPEAEEPTDYTELDAAHDQISDLQSELVVARMGDIPDEEKQQAATLIAELRAEVKTLTATLKAAYLSRDSLMEENAQLKRQCLMNMRELKKLRKE